MNTQDMAVIGLTGGIGSGKSTVAAQLRASGVPVIDADQVAREIVEPGSPVLQKIAEAFGEEFLDEVGALRRQALGALVFSDPEKLQQLNELTHPAILLRVQERLMALRADGHPWVVYEAALIIERALTPGLTELIAVVCEPRLQLDRIVARDGLDTAAAADRIAAQTTNDRRREVSDHVVENDGDLAALRDEVETLLERLSTTYGAPRSDGT
ncbi:MAG: dephospho-CoA kinase [Deltaproteobacteria bacterium]|nr:dephospho-CoA kinase [Deltaproteobacteria bacterium]